jgi:nucleoside-diphosphate-sugar epimerase
VKVLITGDEGFVGREFRRQLPGFAEVTGVDIKSGSDCREWFKWHNDRFDLVIHLAAIVGGRMKIEGAPIEVATDLAIDADFWQWVMRTQPGRVVYFSSSAAYPTFLQVHGSEWRLAESDINLAHVATPDATYGWVKLTGEVLADYVRDAGIPVHVFRPFSGYGTDQDLDYPFPSFIARGLRKDDPFDVWGDGTQVRDFIHIRDVVRAVFAAIEQDYQQPLNLGTGVATSFNELAELVMVEAGYRGAIRHLGDRPVGCHFRVADVTEMRKVYEPEIDLREGVQMALRGVV